MRLPQMSFRSVGALAALWGIVFSGFHFYWAAGGELAHDASTQSLGESVYIAFIAVVGLAGTAVAVGLYEPRGGLIAWRRLTRLARAGGLALLLGVVVGVARWVADGSLGDDGAAEVVITAYFFVGGLLYSRLGWPGRAVTDLP